MAAGRNTETEQRRAPVYVAFKTFLAAVETLQQGIPARLDRSVWPSFSGGVQSHILGAFKFLGLTDNDGQVQLVLGQLVNARGDQRKSVLREIIETRYSEAIRLAERNASFQQLLDLFRESGVQGGTLERAVRFFLDASGYAGLKGSPLWAKARKTIRRQSSRDEPSTKDRQAVKLAGEGITPNFRSIALRSGGTVSLSVSADLMALSRQDREWLFELIDHLNDYGDRPPEPTT